jgi:stage II sporulation protein D
VGVGFQIEVVNTNNQLMLRRLIITVFSLIFIIAVSSGQVRVRLFSDRTPESAVFSVTSGKYEFNSNNGFSLILEEDGPVIISRYNGKLAVKIKGIKGFLCDSLSFTGKTGKDFFSLRINGPHALRKYYSGDLYCFPDMATLLFINSCDIESYISGVVETEGGRGKNIEYFKTQAIIARTYLYKNFDRHNSDRFNVCDNTHCQAYNGLSNDLIIKKAVSETRGLVIIDKDSTLIISAFHSNCGGETSSSEDVWLSELPYLKKVIDPYCLTSRNATWSKVISVNDWLIMLENSGYTGRTDDPSLLSFYQKTRVPDYITGTFRMPLRDIRANLNLMSTFFSVIPRGDSLLIKGRGYGHGVGLCQEGAMVMAEKGFSYKQIIDFYYTGVDITDIKNAVILPPNL